MHLYSLQMKETGLIGTDLPKVKEEAQSSSTPAIARIPLLSFFAGAGFLDIGFMQLGFDIIWRNEYNLSFVKGFEYAMAHMPDFKQNGNGKVHNTCSVTSLEAKQIAREAFHNLPRPEVFGIIGGPPCPDFSNAGKHRGREGDHGKLSQVYTDIIIELKPTFFLFENVPGLLYEKKHRQFLCELLNRLAADYFVDINILNALEYGVPQDRKRLFLIGFLKKSINKNIDIQFFVEHTNWEAMLPPVKKLRGQMPLMENNWFPWPVHQYKDAKTRYSWPEQSPFGAQPEKPAEIPDELMIGSLISSVDELAILPNGLDAFNPKSIKFTSVPEGDVSGKSFKRLHRWRYSPAAAYGHNEVHLHPTEPRRLTVREAFRIQTVPDTYAFPQDMPLSHKFKMIGNGVPVKLARAIAGSFATILLPKG